MIDRNAERLLRLVEDLLITAQASAGNLALEKGELDIAAIIAQAVQASTPVATARGIALNCSTEPLPAADGDRLRIGQVIDNLVSNALKFTPAGGTIDVRAYPHRSAVRIEVTDTGMGIAEDEQAQLFDRFFRTARRRNRRSRASGSASRSRKRSSRRTRAGSPSAASRASARHSSSTCLQSPSPTGSRPPDAPATLEGRGRADPSHPSRRSPGQGVKSRNRVSPSLTNAETWEMIRLAVLRRGSFGHLLGGRAWLVFLGWMAVITSAYGVAHM